MKSKRTIMAASVFGAAALVGVAVPAIFTVLAARAEQLMGSMEPTSIPRPVTESREVESYPPPAPPLPVPDEEPRISQGDEDEFYPDGTYGLYSDDVPKEFSDVKYIEITTIDFDQTNEDGTNGVPIPPKGFLKARKPFGFARIAVSGRQIAFQTETVNGMSYQFTGRFRTRAEFNGDESVGDLTGRLTKLKKGKKSAAVTVDLFIEGC